ncbi:MAG: STAS domain-containing protein [Pseudonocardia sp.]
MTTTTREVRGPGGWILVLCLAGDIDLATQDVVGTALKDAIGLQPADLVVDLAGVRFCGVRGFALLSDAAHAARARGIGYAVSGFSVDIDLVAAIVGMDQDTVRFRSVDAALVAIRVDQTYRLR